MRLKYNAPVVLTYAITCTVVLFISGGLQSGVPPGAVAQAFMVLPAFDPTDHLDYFRVVSHTMGHSNWSHLLANLSLILVIGPVLEEKYGSGSLLIMMFFTALITGILNIAFADTALLGASGIVFMMIMLSSLGSFKQGEIPLTFVLVLGLYLGKEFMDSFKDDNISQFAHIIGGLCGSVFGLVTGYAGTSKPDKVKAKDKGQPPKKAPAKPGKDDVSDEEYLRMDV